MARPALVLGALVLGVALGAGFWLRSPAFGYGEPIPPRYTCAGENLSPPLVWGGVPRGAAALVLAVLDPDAPGGTFVHWVAYDLPPDLEGLEEGASRKLPYKQAVNDFGRVGYGGPCPPPGAPHRYFFRLYALPRALGLPGGVGARRVLARLGEVGALGEAVWMGTFRR